MSDIPLEYFLPLPQANADGEIVGARHLPAEIAQALHALRISVGRLRKLREQHLHQMRLVHEPEMESHQRAKHQAQDRVRQARRRQATYPDNLGRQQKTRDKLDTRLRLRGQAYSNQEQRARNWFPPYYKDGRFDAGALGHTLRSQLPGVIPSFIASVVWIDQHGVLTLSPHSTELNKEALRKDETFRAFVTDLFEAFYSWCPPERQETEVFAERLSPLQQTSRLRYIKQAEDLTVAVINHAVPTLRYIPSDLRYLLPREKLSTRQRLPRSIPQSPFGIPSNTPSEDLTDIRKETYEASLFDPYGL